MQMYFCRYVPPLAFGVHENIACLGCCKKTPGIISMDEASKGLRTQGQTVTKVDGSEDFWSSSTFKLDHSAAHSQRSISSIGMPNNPSDPQSSGGSQTGPPEFVNHGLLLWNHIRQQWIGNKRSESITEIQEPRIRLNWLVGIKFHFSKFKLS
ncbi:hypothetical protein GLYMA_14G116900v4 [Glycine max]|nr:hypothetical protein GLYMA_14G116900v4 [Glycine max]